MSQLMSQWSATTRLRRNMKVASVIITTVIGLYVQMIVNHQCNGTYIDLIAIFFSLIPSFMDLSFCNLIVLMIESN